jgi:Uma2 family endonuclease
MHMAPATPQAAVRLRMPPGLRMDDAQLYAFCRENPDYRIEREIQGEIEIMPPTDAETGRRNTDLVTELNLWARADGSGVVFDSSTGFRLPNGATRSPDAAWVARHRLAGLGAEDKERFLPLAPDFVVELASPKDDPDQLADKMAECRACGVRLGWLLLPAASQARIYRPAALPSVVEGPRVLDGGDVLPGFRLDLGLIWASVL